MMGNNRGWKHHIPWRKLQTWNLYASAVGYAALAGSSLYTLRLVDSVAALMEWYIGDGCILVPGLATGALCLSGELTRRGHSILAWTVFFTGSLLVVGTESIYVHRALDGPADETRYAAALVGLLCIVPFVLEFCARMWWPIEADLASNRSSAGPTDEEKAEGQQQRAVPCAGLGPPCSAQDQKMQLVDL